MDEITKKENDWQDRATDAAIAGARKIALGSSPLMNTPVGRLSDGGSSPRQSLAGSSSRRAGD
jgi:hypothetical protein